MKKDRDFWWWKLIKPVEAIQLYYVLIEVSPPYYRVQTPPDYTTVEAPLSAKYVPIKALTPPVTVEASPLATIKVIPSPLGKKILIILSIK